MIKNIYRFLSPRFQSIHLDYKVKFKPRLGTGPSGSNQIQYNIINKGRLNYENVLSGLLAYKEVFLNIKSQDKEVNADEPAWNNGFLPGLDIVALYGILRINNPKKYVEIGSGNSTKVVRKAIRDGDLTTKVYSIDPFPRANIDHLADKVIRQPIENIESFELFDTLEEGDILFIDNSHRCLPNSDVTVCFLEILPRLKKGVIVHVHDIYMPYDYPQDMCDRAYSEQYILASIFIANPDKYKIILPNYFISEDNDLSGILSPLWSENSLKNVERHGGSFWFEVL